MSETRSNQSQAQRITIIGSVIDTVLGVLKIVFGMLSHSSALIADGIHSLSDLLTDFLVVWIIRYSHQEPDDEHPWGHARFETIGTVILGCILIAVAGAMAYESLLTLIRAEVVQLPEWPALVIAAISVLAKEAIFRYTLTVGKRIKSDLIIANAWHSRTDAFSSIVVFFGVAGAMAGLAWLDSVAAIGVALIIAKVGWDLTWKSILELVDTALPEEQTQAYTDVIMGVEGILSVHSFKSRSMGSQSLLEMHLQVAPHLSASEGHYIGDKAVLRLMKKFEDIGHIIFHIDTYDDEEEFDNSTSLPVRTEISGILWELLEQTGHPQLGISRLALYYRRDSVEIELMLLDTPTNQQIDMKQLETELDRLFRQYRWFRSIRLWQGYQPPKL
ncbi:cation diffusion facilitator family transporter [Amphritea atlantica]|uniref:Cation diffusion facilitator family transporter n=1 Tax=Amphritea atlantica TaxID=355243 RepID=A0A1H9FMT1_9GAMM|nr:cation diffusion facilitator family transporter [Amphritea atlantica]SEQ38763.1 cation diffusion facilitator family transporter [Amphritea atlantica]